MSSESSSWLVGVALEGVFESEGRHPFNHSCDAVWLDLEPTPDLFKMQVHVLGHFSGASRTKDGNDQFSFLRIEIVELVKEALCVTSRSLLICLIIDSKTSKKPRQVVRKKVRSLPWPDLRHDQRR